MGISRSGTQIAGSLNVATLNISGGTVSVGAGITMAQQFATNNASGLHPTAVSTINLTGGSVSVAGDILCGIGVTNPAPRIATLSLNGVSALLDLKGFTIGGTAHNPTNYLDVLDFEAGTLQNVAEINGGTAPLVMNGSGTLLVRSNNTYSGGTIVSNGTLEASSDGALGLGDVRVAGGTLKLDGGSANSNINPAANLRFDGSQQANLAFSGAPNHIAGLYFAGVAQATGTWGATGSGATHPDDTHFTGSGQVLVTTSSSIVLTSAPNPSVVGQAVIFTATVSGGAGTPTGTVTFKNGATVLGAGTLASGATTLTNSSLPAGTNLITAVYGGSTTYTPVTSAVLQQVVTTASAPPPPPSVASVSKSGTNLVMVTIGATNGTYWLLTSTSVTLARTNWTSLATNHVGADGLFTNTIPINSGEPQRFYLLSIPFP